MKEFVRRILVFSIIFTIFVIPFEGGAANDKPLYEKFGYVEDFKYDDERIGHALKATVPYIVHQYTAVVEFTPVIFNKEAVANLKKNNPKASSSAISKHIEKNLDAYFTNGTPVDIQSGFAATGSGVVISEDGYIATNAHVASEFPGNMKYSADEETVGFTIDNIMDKLLIETVAEGVFINDFAMNEFSNRMYSSIRRVNETDEIYVCFPTENGDTSLSAGNKYEAQLIEEGVPVNVSSEGLTQDAAILKIAESGLVALKLSPTYPEANSRITSAGYPGVADEIFKEGVGSNASVLSVTIGTGNISRIIPIEGSAYKAMEITTNISNGSSGGPSIDEQLNVEGLNTYGNTSDNRFAYMVPSEYVKELSSGRTLTHGEVTKTFLTGLQMLQQNYGKAALECFEEVKRQRPATPYINNIIDFAKTVPQEYPEGVEEESVATDGKKGKGGINTKLVVIIVCIAVAFLLNLVGVILIVSLTKRKKALKEDEKDDMSVDVLTDTIERGTLSSRPVGIPAEAPVPTASPVGAPTAAPAPGTSPVSMPVSAPEPPPKTPPKLISSTPKTTPMPMPRYMPSSAESGHPASETKRTEGVPDKPATETSPWLKKPESMDL